MDWIVFLRVLSIVLVTLTSVCFFYQIVYLLLPYVNRKRPQAEKKTARYAVLIPARNEEAVLPHLLQSLREQTYSSELIDIYVIADNCTDRTAQIAREGGAEVVERFDREQIGKGYALQYLLSHIRQTKGLDAYDAFLVFDADNLLDKGYIQNIHGMYEEGYEVFCGYRNSKNFSGGWVAAGYSVWYLHGSTHLNRSRMVLGTSCAVNGTGFGFTRETLRRIGDDWRFFTLTEDLEFNAWCITNGIKIGYCHDAILYDEQPITFRVSVRQRIRWVQGGFQIAFKYAGALFRGLFKGNWISYSCYETMTVSLWGYGLGALSGITTVLLTGLEGGWPALGILALTALPTAYVSLLLIGLLTVLTDRKRIRAKTRQKVLAVFAFPLFMLTFVPLAVIAPFCKFEWVPVEHTVAVGTDSLE